MGRVKLLWGILRSLVIYYAIPFRLRRMKRFYGQFIRPGDLCFDIGAHVGNRIRAWSRIGARIVALEPLPVCQIVLNRLYRRCPNVHLLQKAAGASPDKRKMYICETSPTLTTLSGRWIRKVKRVRTFKDIRWESALSVDVTTLNALIRQYGAPAFIKIDVEGFELEVLKGLSRPLRSLSFELLPADIETGLACIDRLLQLGDYEFNYSLVETMRLFWSEWKTGDEIKSYLGGLPREARSGDIYARLA